MSADTLRAIYLGTITNWSQIPGGGSGPIRRYLPEARSGTRVTFTTKVLGFEPPVGVPGVSDPVVVVENRGTAIGAADSETAIYPYSLGKWVNQYTNRVNPSIDVRDGTRAGAFCTPTSAPGSVPSASCAASSPSAPNVQVGLRYNTVGTGSYLLNAPVLTDASAMPASSPGQGVGAQFLYHVLNPSQDAASYAAARNLVGTGSVLAAGGFSSSIRTEGYLDLDVGAVGDPRQPDAIGKVRVVTARSTP